jgi:beta-lactamase regulating signal transducer with metallopeptidase domain
VGDWKGTLASIWLCGSAAWFGLALWRIRRFALLLRHARPAPADVQEQAGELAARLGLRHVPRVELLPGVISPMLWTLFGAPRLLLPATLLPRLDRAQRATLLTHELAHLLRRDHCVRILELAASGLYWWHPVVWWARRELREAEEQCCDAWVVSTLPRAARDYAAALLETIDFLSDVRLALPPAASGIGHVSFLKRRLTMIMQANTPRTLSWAGFLTLLGIAAVWLPTWVRAEPPKEEREKIIRELKELRSQTQNEKIQKDVERLIEDLTSAVKEKANEQKRLAQDAAEKVKAKAKEQAEEIKKQYRIELRSQLTDDKREKIQDAIKKIEIMLEDEPAKGKEAAKPNPEELKKAKDELSAARKQLAEAQRRVAEASRKIAKLSGQRAVYTITRDGATTIEGKVQRVYPGADMVIPVPPVPPVPRIDAPRPPSAARTLSDSDRRISDLEKRLSELLREVKSLRQEMQQSPKPKTSKPTAMDIAFPVEIDVQTKIN